MSYELMNDKVKTPLVRGFYTLNSLYYVVFSSICFTAFSINSVGNKQPVVFANIN